MQELRQCAQRLRDAAIRFRVGRVTGSANELARLIQALSGNGVQSGHAEVMLDRLDELREFVSASRRDALKGDAAELLRNLQISASRIDGIINHAGQAIIAGTELKRLLRETNDRSLYSAAERLNRLVAQIQTDLLNSRLQPLSTLFDKLPRTLRNQARAEHKLVRFLVTGEGIELDRDLIAGLAPCLLELLRYVIQTLIEVPSERIKNAKAPTATIYLDAEVRENRVLIHCKHDGRTVKDRARYPDTWERVRTSLAWLGGQVEAGQESQNGTQRLTLSLPQTLAIRTCLLISSGDLRWALPQPRIVELIRPESPHRHEEHEASFIYHGMQLPLLDLRGQDHNKKSRENSTPSVLILVRAEPFFYGIRVDHLVDVQDVLIRPIRRRDAVLPATEGVALLYDGTAVDVVDVAGLARRWEIPPVENRRAPGNISIGC